VHDGPHPYHNPLSPTQTSTIHSCVPRKKCLRNQTYSNLLELGNLPYKKVLESRYFKSRIILRFYPTINNLSNTISLKVKPPLKWHPYVNCVKRRLENLYTYQNAKQINLSEERRKHKMSFPRFSEGKRKDYVTSPNESKMASHPRSLRCLATSLVNPPPPESNVRPTPNNQPTSRISFSDYIKFYYCFYNLSAHFTPLFSFFHSIDAFTGISYLQNQIQHKN